MKRTGQIDPQLLLDSGREPSCVEGRSSEPERNETRNRHLGNRKDPGTDRGRLGTLPAVEDGLLLTSGDP